MRLLTLALCSLALCAGVVFAAISGADPAFAQVATTVDFGPTTALLIDWLAPIVLVLLLGLSGWILVKLGGLVGLKVNALQRAVIDHGLEKAIGYGLTKLGDRAAKGFTIDLKSELVAVAVKYAFTVIPSALKHFKKTPEDVAAMIEARLADSSKASALAGALAGTDDIVRVTINNAGAPTR